LASFLTALGILSGIRHLLHNSALLIARIVRYFHIPALLDIHGVAMVQLTFVPSLISIEAGFSSFIAIWTCNGRLFNENSHFSQNAHEVMG
jgi:hypothetical protein